MPAFATDTDRMLAAATQLGHVRDQVVSALGKYMTMNNDLASGDFQGTASVASLNTTSTIQSTGKQVSARFDHVIAKIKESAVLYSTTNHDNTKKLGSIPGH